MSSATQPNLTSFTVRPAVDLAVPSICCLVCSGTEMLSYLPGLLRCENCGFVSADLSISDEELRALYSADYFHGNEYLDYIAEAQSLRLNFRNRLPVLRHLLPAWSEADLLEIGCAYGFFLEEVRNEVRSACGIDICREAIENALERGLNAIAGDYLTIDVGRKLDVITMWDTIEHLKHPDLFIQKAASDLKPGGLIALTTGDIGSVVARLRGRSWRMIHPPTHLHYFTVSTLTKLLHRGGFDVVHVSHPGITRNLRSILYFILALRMNRPVLYRTIKSWPIFDLRITSNLFDIMYIVGRLRPR